MSVEFQQTVGHYIPDDEALRSNRYGYFTVGSAPLKLGKEVS
jgi:hypothetical protein